MSCTIAYFLFCLLKQNFETRKSSIIQKHRSYYWLSLHISIVMWNTHFFDKDTNILPSPKTMARGKLQSVLFEIFLTILNVKQRKWKKIQYLLKIKFANFRIWILIWIIADNIFLLLGSCYDDIRNHLNNFYWCPFSTFLFSIFS